MRTWHIAYSIDIKVLKDLGETRTRGTGPRATVKRTAPFTVGRGPVPRHTSRPEQNEQDRSRIYKICKINKIIGAGCTTVPRRRRRPRSVGRERLLSPVRAQASPNYRGGGRTSAGDRPPRYGDFKTNAGDRPPRYGNRGVFIVGRRTGSCNFATTSSFLFRSFRTCMSIDIRPQ